MSDCNALLTPPAPLALSASTHQWLHANHFTGHPDIPGRYGDTALLMAARRGETAIVGELLVLGVNVNHRNMDGTNALWAAIVADREDIADQLLAHGVNIDNLNDNGASVLMYAASAGKTGWVRYLLRRGANRDLTSLDDYTALDLAGNVECLRLLRAR